MSFLLPSARNLNLLIVLGCIFMMAVALIIFERLLELAPCPMCIFQRFGVITVGLIAATAALHNPGPSGTRTYWLVDGFSRCGRRRSFRSSCLAARPTSEDQGTCLRPWTGLSDGDFPFIDVITIVLQGTVAALR